jgi:hypothetical protein
MATTKELSRIGAPPSAKPLNPQAELVFGLLDVVGELAGMLVAKGVFSATELQLVMETRERICREAVNNVQAIPAKTLAEIAAVWAKPRALAFPRDAQVIPLFQPRTDAAANSDPEAPAFL